MSSPPWGDGLTPDVDNGDQHDFAQLDRDLEDETEHAQYRPYSTGLGRWLSPDQYTGSYDFTNPQTFNRYSYANNAPANFVDPSGLDGGVRSNPLYCVIATIGTIVDLDWLLGGNSSFHGSLKTRPSTNLGWDGNFGESLGIPSTIPQGNLGLGMALDLPTQGCEFGSCGGGPGAFTNTAALGAPILPSWVFSVVSLLHIPYADPSDPNHRLFGTHYCGPGGGGSVGPGVDQLCAAHDACYNRENVGWLNNLNPFTSGAAMGGCDRLLCAALEGYQPTSSQERSGKDHIQQVFGCSYILKP